MTDLGVRLRAGVDSVPPVTLHEVVHRSPAPSRLRGRSGVGVRAVVLAAAACVGVVMVIGSRQRASHTQTVAPTQTATSVALGPSMTECIVSDSNRDGCRVTSQQQQALLGYPAPTPDDLPSGWVLLDQTVRIYEPGTQNPGPTEIRMAHTIWGPPGTSLDAADAQWIRLDVREAIVGEDAAPEPVLWTLPDGTKVIGNSGPATVGDPTAGDHRLRTAVSWVRGGLWYRYESQGRTKDQDLTVINSLQ